MPLHLTLDMSHWLPYIGGVEGIGPRQIKEIGTMDCHACHEKIEDGGVEVETTYRLDDLRQIDRVIICEGCFHDGAGDDIGGAVEGVY